MSSFVINKQEYIKAGGFCAALADQRITPACAGKGDFLKDENPLSWGSPPLVRGKDLQRCKL